MRYKTFARRSTAFARRDAAVAEQRCVYLPYVGIQHKITAGETRPTGTELRRPDMLPSPVEPWHAAVGACHGSMGEGSGVRVVGSTIRSGFEMKRGISKRRPAVAVFSKADRSGGGASLIAEDLADLLNQAGAEAQHWITSGGPTLRAFQRHVGGRPLAAVLRRLHGATRQFGLPDVVPWEYAALRRKLHAYDVAHFHDISSAFSPLTVRWVARRLPTVWTFHDCSPFTGGCLYPFACTAFQRRCGGCPQLDRWPLGGRLRLDFTGVLQDIKRRTAAEHHVVAVTPSQWMADEALRSGMFPQRPRVIPNWVDSETFRPRDRAALRRELGLETDRFWTLISAGSLADERKGTRYAIEAIRRCGRNIGRAAGGPRRPALAAELAGTALPHDRVRG